MYQRVLSIFIALAIVFTVAGPQSAQADDNNLIIATATTGGTYYPVGVAIGTLLSIKLAKDNGITATAINSAGSGENVQMLKNKEADLAILQALFGLNAYQGKGPYEGNAYKDFRAITMLWENVEHFALLNDHVKTGTIEDLKGLDGKFSIGKRGSGTEGSGRTILTALGIDPDSLSLEYLGYNPSAQAMMDGRIVGANIPAGPPAAAITQLYAQLGADEVTVLDFTDEQLATIDKEYPIWGRYVIKAGTYPSQEKDINTISQPNFLACRADLPDETVYQITKTIYENLPFLHNIHKATMAMSLDRATKGLPAPLHPGAEKYYREVGIIK
ncbi:TAXI family TRAP transporter solute-binding subunit [Oceanidesulfovibrio marinus]|uniref:C4-dicarboxylate ABC transporter substrate-binding protein n=1 Tax=Oceanidesulfovibrio marinus TaxID=370038 RepID=A0A6P1ZIV7_9BACT|nr:TAXI family TRAP transporter solute-binding subunit [Oceanidesulfovibrio marinus]QJT07898.1 TAXI family TRAP transporter solute-binding subunit [Oceanidesulfovibrio marinus]TVM33398.1 C4-dicarboxylate ABC transporter substrate-binding protein [Oceanidesulfovibrio marinus]